MTPSGSWTTIRWMGRWISVVFRMEKCCPKVSLAIFSICLARKLPLAFWARLWGRVVSCSCHLVSGNVSSFGFSRWICHLSFEWAIIRFFLEQPESIISRVGSSIFRALWIVEVSAEPPWVERKVKILSSCSCAFELMQSANPWVFSKFWCQRPFLLRLGPKGWGFLWYFAEHHNISLPLKDREKT